MDKFEQYFEFLRKKEKECPNGTITTMLEYYDEFQKIRVESETKYKFDINRPNFYINGKYDQRTKARLTEIAQLGMEEVMPAEFGIPGIMSGLYIELVWSFTDNGFKEYMDWVRDLINHKKGNNT